MPKVAVLYVYYGYDNYVRFIDSIKKHPAGYPHDLLTVFPGEGYNVGAFLDAAKALDHEYLCCCTAYTEFLTDAWLAKLVAPLAWSDVGAVDVMGSFESRRQFGYDGPFAQDFPSFPNPHLRVVCLTIKRQLLLDLNFPRMVSKLDTLRFESGNDGLATRLRYRGLKQFVVGANSTAYPEETWSDSLTFRLGNQENLIAHDKHSRAYRDAAPDMRAWLSKIAYKGADS